MASSQLIREVVQAVQTKYDYLEIGVHLHSSPEQAGDKILAAYDAGCRRFDSAIGGLGEFVGDSGLTFSPGNPRALADAMWRVLDEPDLCASLGAAGRRRILLSFSYRGMIDAHACLYRAVCAAAKA